MTGALLLVGDRPFCRKTSEQILSLEAEILTAQSYGEAETLIYNSPPHLLLLQASQPLNWELCQQIKQGPQLSWIYCILLVHQSSALSLGADDISKTILALAAGANAYLALPTADPSYEELLRAYVAAGLRQASLYRTLSQENNFLSAIALSDALTQIGNRRAFDWELSRQIKNAQDKGLDFSLLLIDIDYFKSVNDTYGHLVGDQVLRLLAERLKHNMRFDDTPYRYGGEEFAITLTDTGAAEAAQIAQRLCQLIHQHPFSVIPASPEQELVLPITVSVGVASLRQDGTDSGMALLQRADQNLLKAKSTGRNRAVSG
ncbi:MAG: diguanylate cyclase [Leptolyngbya sp. SIO4C5]|uniref:GGDEF domain-containing response regulator n=1 Tax=Sphaerothrix gracilis TaxID=3151835 RepID=UPI0013BF8725|nr:diguanylate cyclase [Leptolyngbya sp. SIO4C5]